MKNGSDLISNKHLHIHDGTSQTSRLLPALDEQYFQLIDLRFHSLLALAVDYAEMMKFYHLNNTANGTWKSYFLFDETISIAFMLSTDTDKLVTLFKKEQYPAKYRPDVINALQAALPPDCRQQLIAVYCAAGILDGWLLSFRAAQSHTGRELHQLIESVVAGLLDDLQLLLQCFAYYLPNTSPDTFFSRDLIQLLTASVPGRQFRQLDCSTRPTDHITIRSIFYAVIKAIEMVQNRAADLLTDSLNSQRHDPASGLLIAFLRLFQRLHQKFNRFTSNYIDFYYDQVLGAQVKSFEPDHTFLVTRLTDRKQKVLIPKATVFLAELDSKGQAILYASDEDTLIHGARVGTIHTVFFNRDPLNSPENILQETVFLSNLVEKKNRQLATECWLNTIPVLNAQTSKNREDMMAYPLLGAPKNTETGSVSAEHARIGFVLASKTLLLKEGNRHISLTIQFAKSESATFKQWIHKITAALKPSMASDTDGTISEEEEQDIFFKIFRDIFIIHVSGEESWLPIEEYVPAYSGVDNRLDENSLRIAFALSADAPAIMPYSDQVHGDRFETELPVVKFTLNPRSYLYPYSVLSKLSLEWIEIDVSVAGIHALSLYNHLGKLSSLAAFNPFGPLPEVGSYFLVGCAEAAIKQLTDFSVEIKWGGLPSGIGGFTAYYQDYDGPNNHTDFKIAKSVLMEGKWFPDDVVPNNVDTLFQIKNAYHASNTVSEIKKISCNALIPYWSPLEYGHAVTEFGYTPSSKKGFFRFTLIEPAEAFGHKKYPQVLAHVLTYNARQRISKSLKPEPNTPYTPVSTSILANYQAATRMIIEKEETGCLPVHRDKLIHLHPLGWEDTILLSGQSVFLLPQYAYSGNLLIGLEMFEEGGLLTLYFHLHENALPTENNPVEGLQWFFLSSNQWIPLAAREIISDSTHGFMTSGIVTLDIPPDINSNNTILPDAFFWLRLSADQDMEKFCSLYSIHAQALKVSRLLNDGEHAHDLIPFKPLPAGSIRQTKQSIPGLDNIWQIQPSVGGKSAEDKIAVRIRMSERLRHKHRALLPLDYEQVILASFPQIYKVKCFANLIPEPDPHLKRIRPCIRPGHVTIVLLPYPTEQAHYGRQLWLSGHLVSEVKNFIDKYTSSCATVHFVNPVYENIQVRCTVKLKSGQSGGLYLGRLNQAISDYISPWHDAVGYTTHFGWRISVHDVQSYIQQLDFVDRVTNFSILRITPDGDALYDLSDSVAESKMDTTFCEITPKYPWSISEPLRQHFIEIDNSFAPIEPEVTGIGELEIGSTFIVLNRDGETK